MVALRRLAVGAAVAAAGGAAALAGRQVVRRERRKPDSAAGEDFVTLADLAVEHLEVATRDGGRLHLLAKGRGRPILLLHGILLQAGAWRYQFDLADEFRVLALDQRGHGLSLAGSDGYGLEQLANDLADVVEALDLRDTVVVGHSMGGMGAMRFARRHRELFHERVTALALIATSPLPVFGFGSRTVARSLASAFSGPARLLGWDRVPTYRPGDDDFNFGIVRLSFGAGTPPHLVEATRRMVAAMRPEVFSQSMVGLTDNDERRHLDEITVPTAVLVGGRDLLTPPRHARMLAEKIPDATLAVYDGAGHQLMMERPAINDDLRQLAQRSIAVSANPIANPAAGA